MEEESLHVHKNKGNGIMKMALEENEFLLQCIRSWRHKCGLGIIVCTCANRQEGSKSEDAVVSAIKTGHEMPEYSFKTVH